MRATPASARSNASLGLLAVVTISSPCLSLSHRSDGVFAAPSGMATCLSHPVTLQMARNRYGRCTAPSASSALGACCECRYRPRGGRCRLASWRPETPESSPYPPTRNESRDAPETVRSNAGGQAHPLPGPCKCGKPRRDGAQALRLFQKRATLGRQRVAARAPGDKSLSEAAFKIRHAPAQRRHADPGRASSPRQPPASAMEMKRA